MVQAADGGGGGGNAGPHELKLIQAYRANLESLTKAAQSWTAGADLLNAVARALDSQAGQLETSFGPNNPTGKAAAERYREVQAKVLKRADEMATASGALEHSRSGLEAAQADHQSLPPVTTNPNEPQTDLERLMDPGGGLKQAKHDGERAEREKAAGAALTKLDTHFEKSAQDLRTVAGDRPGDGGGGGGGRGGGSAGTSPLSGGGGGTHTVSGVPSGGGGGGRDDDRGTVITDFGPRGPSDDGDPGTTPTTTPPGTVPVGGALSGGTDDSHGGSSSGGAYGGGGTATPTPGSGAGVTSAMGAGVVSGAGAIAASRGGIPVTRAVAAPGSSTGAIGRSASTAARGAIGRGGSMVPGQGSTAGRAGTSGRGAAAGRGGVAAGQGQGQAGKSGGRGGAGTRGGGAAAAGQTGRGKKEEKDVTQEHLAFADEESWLDDEGANDPVID